MIRQPSTAVQLYAWHRAAMAGHAPPIHDGMPECGWYRTKLVKGGPWVAVGISVERDIDPDTGELTEPERLVCVADGMRRDPAKLWTFLTPISRAEYLSLLDRRNHIPAMAATLAKLDLSLSPMRP